MSSERADQPATPDNQPPVHGVPGRVLAAQREAMGWSVEQVADQLKLAVRQVVALEAGDYASLPSPAVTRGFVRAYAKLVKVDPAPLVAQIAMETEPAPDTSAVTANRRPTPTSFSQSKFPSHGKRSSLPLGMIAGAAVVVVGEAGEKELCDAVVQGAQQRDVAAASVAGRLDLGELAAVLGDADVVIANDSGPRHLAHALGTATVGVYWIGNLINAGPLTRAHHRVPRDAPVTGRRKRSALRRPCHRPPCIGPSRPSPGADRLWVSPAA